MSWNDSNLIPEYIVYRFVWLFFLVIFKPTLKTTNIHHFVRFSMYNTYFSLLRFDSVLSLPKPDF